MCALLGHSRREAYPKARCTTSKRGPKIAFGPPVDGQDPTVDMVLALTRRNGAGLWIPNLRTNRWEASHPERHVELFTSVSGSVKLLVARTVAARRLRTAAGALADALDHDADRDAVRSALSRVFPTYFTYFTYFDDPVPSGLADSSRPRSPGSRSRHIAATHRSRA